MPNAGDHAVRLGNEAEIRHSLQLEKGSAYSVTFSAARTCAQLESLNVSVGPASNTVDLQTLYSVEGWDAYAWAFQAESEDAELAFKNPGMEDDPTCGPIIDNVAIKKLFTPDAVEGIHSVITNLDNIVSAREYCYSYQVIASVKFCILVAANHVANFVVYIQIMFMVACLVIRAGYLKQYRRILI